jgi:hypothetical protein
MGWYNFSTLNSLHFLRLMSSETPSEWNLLTPPTSTCEQPKAVIGATIRHHLLEAEATARETKPQTTPLTTAILPWERHSHRWWPQVLVVGWRYLQLPRRRRIDLHHQWPAVHRPTIWGWWAVVMHRGWGLARRGRRPFHMLVSV